MAAYSTPISLKRAREMYLKFLEIKENVHTAITTDAPLNDDGKRFLLGKKFITPVSSTEPALDFKALDFEIAFFFTKEMIEQFAAAMKHNSEINGVALTLAAWDKDELDKEDKPDIGRPTLISSLCKIKKGKTEGSIEYITLYDMSTANTAISAVTADATIVGREHPIGGKYNGTTDQLFLSPVATHDVTYNYKVRQ